MVYCIQIKHHIRYTAFGDIFMVQIHTILGYPYAVYRIWINIHLLYTEYGAPCMEIAYFIWVTICVIPYMVNSPNTVFRKLSNFSYQILHVLAHPVQQQTSPIHSCS